METDVDNSYSEVGPSHCPDTKVKRHGGLFWLLAQAVAVVGLTMIFGTAMLGGSEPGPAPTPTPDPVPIITPTPTPDPTPDSTPEPTPTPATTSYRVHYYLEGTSTSIAPDAYVSGATVGDEVTVTAPTFEGYTLQSTGSATITLVEDWAENTVIFYYSITPTPDNPTPTPQSPKPPTITIDHIWWWPGLEHLQLEYTIAANDGTGLSSTSTMTAVVPMPIDPDDPDSPTQPEELTTFSFDGVSGAGTIDRNVTTMEEVYVDDPSDLTIKAEVTLTYTLQGQTKTITKTVEQAPTLKEPITMKVADASQSGVDPAERAVTVSVQFRGQTSDPHDLVPELWLAELVLTNQDPDSAAYNEDLYTEDLWSGWSGPVGPTTDGGDNVWTWTFDDTLDVDPVHYGAEGATHYKIRFYFSGDATYTDKLVNGDSDEYGIYGPYMVETDPLPIEIPHTPPTISIDHIWYWPGLHHLQIEYTVTANEGEDITTTSVVTDMIPDPDHPGEYEEGMFMELDEVDGAGTFDRNFSAIEVIYAEEGEVPTVKVDVDLSYTFGGLTKAVSKTVTQAATLKEPITLAVADVSQQGYDMGERAVTATVQFRAETEDPHDYAPILTSVELYYLMPDDDDPSEYVELYGTTFWGGWTGPSDPTTDGGETVWTWVFEDTIDVDPESYDVTEDANQYKLVFNFGGAAEYTGTVINGDTTDYEVREPSEVATEPLPTELPATLPSVTIDNLYYWPDFFHFSAEYTVTKEDAEDVMAGGILYKQDSDDPLIEFYGENSDGLLIGLHYLSGEEDTFTDDADFNDFDDPDVVFNDGDIWRFDVHLYWTIDGDDDDTSVPANLPIKYVEPIEITFEDVEGASTDIGLSVAGTAKLRFDTSDRHSLEPELDGVRVYWYIGNPSDDTAIPMGYYPLSFEPGDMSMTTEGQYEFFTVDIADVVPQEELEEMLAAGVTHWTLGTEYSGTATDLTYGGEYGYYGLGESGPISLGVEPTPDGAPEVDITHLYYWPDLRHLSVTYSVTANQATDITSGSVLYNEYGHEEDAFWWEYGGTIHGLHPGDGLIIDNDETDGEMVDPQEGFVGTITVTLFYTLDSEERTSTVSEQLPVEIMRPYSLEVTEVSGTPSDGGMLISSETVAQFSTSDRHTYAPEPERGVVVWYKLDPSDGSPTAVDYTNLFDITTESESTGSNVVYTYGCSATVPADEVNAALAAGATHWAFRFVLDGTAKDKLDNTTYEFANYLTAESEPMVIPGSASDLTAPTVTITNLYWWPSLYHFSAEYEVTAHDGQSIVSTGSLWLTSDSSPDFAFDPHTGPGTFTDDAETYDVYDFEEGEEVRFDVELSYTLGGVPKTETVSETLPVTFVQPYSVSLDVTEKDFNDDGLTVTAEAVMRVDGADRHSFEPTISSARIGWHEVDPDYGAMSASDFTTIDVSDLTPAVTTEGTDQVYTFVVEAQVPADTVNDMMEHGATHWQLTVTFGGTATDTEDPAASTYVYRRPDARSGLIPLSGGSSTLVEPTLDISHLYHWGTLNAEGGLNQWEVEFTIVPGDADEDSFSSTVTVTQTWNSSSVTRPPVSGSGTKDVNFFANGALVAGSASEFLVEVTTSYTIGGESKTIYESLTIAPSVWQSEYADAWGSWEILDLTTNSYADGVLSVSGTFGLGYTTGDRHAYSVTPTSLFIQWCSAEYEWDDPTILGTTVIWSGGGESPFSGPSSSSGDKESTITYSFSLSGLEVTPPDGTNYYRICASGTAVGTDVDGSTWTVNRAIDGTIDTQTQLFAL